MALQETMGRQERGELQGLIQIECTEEGEQISVMGAFADRMQYGALALIKALGIMADKIADSDGAGDSYSPTIRAAMPKKKRAPARAFVETTDLAPLELPRRRMR